MTKTTKTDYKTVEVEEDAYKCDKCNAIVDADHAYKTTVNTLPESQHRNSSETFHLCKQCVNKDRYATLQEYETTVEKRREYLETIIDKLSFSGSVLSHIVAAGFGIYTSTTVLTLLAISTHGSLSSIVYQEPLLVSTTVVLGIIFSVPIALKAYPKSDN